MALAGVKKSLMKNAPLLLSVLGPRLIVHFIKPILPMIPDYLQEQCDGIHLALPRKIFNGKSIGVMTRLVTDKTQMQNKLWQMYDSPKFTMYILRGMEDGKWAQSVKAAKIPTGGICSKYV